MAAGTRIKRFVKIAAGVALLIFGVIGLFLPILQGILMIMGGLALLSTEIRAVKAFNLRAMRWMRKRFRRFKARPHPGNE